MQKITPFLWFDGKAEDGDPFLCLRFQEFKSWARSLAGEKEGQGRRER